MKSALKIYLYFPGEDIHTDGNPFVYTLVDAIITTHKDVYFAYAEHIFWTSEVFEYDMVHIMWPDSLILWRQEKHTIEELDGQLKLLKDHNIPLICTCHNLHSHYTWSQEGVKAYDIVYQYADIFIHLEEYSKEVLTKKYSAARHVVIPHHVYDTVYPTLYSKEEALQKLHYKNRKYAISLGAFRNNDEKDLFLRIADEFRKYNIYCIAPSLLVLPRGRITRSWIKQRLRWLLLKLKHPNIITNIGYISNELIPYYYALSDISIIQRLEILNSGNVPLGMYFGNVILGPNVGNVNLILHKTDNPSFDVCDLDSIPQACLETLKAASNSKGQQNREFALAYWTTEQVAEKIYQLYKLVIRS